MTEEERTITKQQKLWGHNNRVFSHDVTVAILLPNSPFNSSEMERTIYQFTKSHLWGSFIPGHPSISLRTADAEICLRFHRLAFNLLLAIDEVNLQEWLMCGT